MAGATIDSLELELQSNAGQAVTGIDSLVAALNRLKTAATGGISGLNTISDQLLSLSSALSVMTEDSSKINTIAESIDKLSSVGESSGLNGFANDIEDVGKALNELNDGNDSLDEVAESAEDLGNTSADLNKVADSIDSIDKEVKELNTSNKKLVKSMVDIESALKMSHISIKAIFKSLADVVTLSNRYIENMNLFQVTMGEYADEAQKYAEKVGELMGIDPGEWMRNQGVFNTIIKGFGVASDKAAFMSKNLTQLGYDLSSFYNISVSDAMHKLESGIAGELEPLRRLGYDLSIARLQQEALNLGIKESVNNMTQAEKSQLRYYAILTQVTDAQTDMARTLYAPANQLRILSAQIQLCARSIGNLFIPILNAVIPYIIAFVRVLREAIEAIAAFFGIAYSSKSDIFSGIGASMGGAAAAADDMSAGAGGAAKNLGKASEKAKKLKSYLLGIDELNIISPDNDDDPLSNLANGGLGGGLGDLGGGGDLGIELPGYDFLNGIEDRISEITERVKDFIPWIGALGFALAGLKLAKFIGNLFGIKNILKELGKGAFLQSWIGSIMILAGVLTTLWSAIDAIVHGVNWKNAAGILGGVALATAGVYNAVKAIKPELATLASGLTAIAGGILEISIAVFDMGKNGINRENILLFLGGTATALFGVAKAMKSIKSPLSKLGVPIASFATSMVGLYASLKDFIKNGPNVENTFMLIASAVAGVGTAIWAVTKAFELSPLTGIVAIAGTAAAAVFTISRAIEEAGVEAYQSTEHFQVMEAAIETARTKAEEATAGLEEMKRQVENLNNLDVNVSIGERLLDEIFAINDNADATAYDIEVMKLKVEQFNELNLGGAQATFNETTGKINETKEALKELLKVFETQTRMEAIKVLLQNAMMQEEESKRSLETVRNKLQMAHEELQKARMAFDEVPIYDIVGHSKAWAKVEETKKAYEELSNTFNLLNEQNQTALDNQAHYMDEYLSLSASLSEQTAEKVKDATDGITSSIEDSASAFEDGSVRIRTTGTEIEEATNNIVESTARMRESGTEYENSARRIADSSGEKGSTAATSFWDSFKENIYTTFGIKEKVLENLPSSEDTKLYGKDFVTGLKLGAEAEMTTFKNVWDMPVDMALDTWEIGSPSRLFKRYGGWLVDGLKMGIEENDSAGNAVENWALSINKSFEGALSKDRWMNNARTVVTAFATGINTSAGMSRTAVTTWAQNIRRWFSDPGYGGVSASQWQTYGMQLVSGFKRGLEDSYPSCQATVNRWASNIKDWFNKPDGVNTLNTIFQSIGKDVIDGFNKGINDYYETTLPYMQKWARAAKLRYKAELDSSSPSKVYMHIGEDTVEGYNIGIEKSIPSTVKTMSTWAKSFVGIAPTVSVDSTALDYANKTAMSQTISGEVVGTYNHTVSTDAFSDSMEDFFRENLSPILRDIASDTKRQADKSEQTNVYVGNRVVTDAVTTQRKANGFSFVGG